MGKRVSFQTNCSVFDENMSFLYKGLFPRIKITVEELDSEYHFPGKFRVEVKAPKDVFNSWKRELSADIEKYPDTLDEIGGNYIYCSAWDASISVLSIDITTITISAYARGNQYITDSGNKESE